jgi:predicted ATPase
MIALATEQGFPLYHALGTIYTGWAKVNTGSLPAGISLLRSGSSAYNATGAKVLLSYHTALLAKAFEIAGQVDEALFLFDDALQASEKILECWFSSELYRHKGQLMLRRGDSEAAEALYRQALAIAKEQEGKLWALRAGVSLARLGRDQGSCSQARAFLAPIYGQFTEGFDTQDLKEAKGLLDEMS